MRVQISVSIGLVGCTDYAEVKIDKEDVEGMTDEELNEYFNEVALEEILGNGLIDWGWEVLE